MYMRAFFSAILIGVMQKLGILSILYCKMKNSFEQKICRYKGVQLLSYLRKVNTHKNCYFPSLNFGNMWKVRTGEFILHLLSF